MPIKKLSYLQPACVKKPGYVVLLSVVIVGALAVAMATSLLLIGSNNQRRQLVWDDYVQARYYANTCAEQGLAALRLNNTLVGTTTLSIAPGSCTYNIINTGGNTRQLQAVGTLNNSLSKILISTSALKPSITVSSWKEVAGF